jgi:N-acetylmuramoyl-L-alanine amidase
MIRGRSFIAAIAACAIMLFIAVPAYPSYNSEAGRAYAIASLRLAELKKSPKKKKYRSYWIDCIRAFELVEKKYPKSPRAGDACFDRAGTYRELYRHSRVAKDIEVSLQSYGKCQSAYPKHARAPEALYRIIEIALYHKKDDSLTADIVARLHQSYPGSYWTAKAKARLKPLARTALKKGRQAPQSKKRSRSASAASGNAIPGGVVCKIRYWSGGDYTRVVIDHEHKVEFQVHELKNPDRLVFDLLNTRLDPSVDKEPLMVNDGILRQVRASQYAPGIARVVLDLASIKSYVAFPLRDPRRLVIDVTGEASQGAETAVEQTADPGSRSEPQSANTPPVNAPEASNGAGLSLSRQLGLKVRTIAIDAGHGGHDPGAIGKRGTKEKDLTLDIAKRLASLVKEGLGCNVVMTRDRDVFVPLEERPAIARTKGADLFVSIHVNASRKRWARGIETYIQGLRASDRDAMATAARENATTAKTLRELDDELARILMGLRMESNDEDSVHLAHTVQGSLVDTVKPIQGHAADLGVKRAFFYVLINTGMPSILAEVGFISNPTEEMMLKKESYRQAIAKALYRGIKQYVDARAPRMTAI